MEPRDTLLLVDDQQADRAVLRELFQEEYNLLEAENGDQALLLLEENHTRIAAVLLDLLMPAKDGFPVLAEMRAKRVLPETPVVVITAQDSAARAARAFELGASDFIVKPFEPCAVRRRVRNLVELSRYKRCLEELAEEQANALRQSNEVMVDTLSSIIEYRGAKSGRAYPADPPLHQAAAGGIGAQLSGVPTGRAEDRRYLRRRRAARHRQDRHTGRYPQQAGPADAGGIRGDEDPFRHRLPHAGAAGRHGRPGIPALCLGHLPLSP